jgi:hypothetical protein
VADVQSPCRIGSADEPRGVWRKQTVRILVISDLHVLGLPDEVTDRLTAILRTGAP